MLLTANAFDSAINSSTFAAAPWILKAPDSTALPKSSIAVLILAVESTIVSAPDATVSIRVCNTACAPSTPPIASFVIEAGSMFLTCPANASTAAAIAAGSAPVSIMLSISDIAPLTSIPWLDSIAANSANPGAISAGMSAIIFLSPSVIIAPPDPS